LEKTQAYFFKFVTTVLQHGSCSFDVDRVVGGRFCGKSILAGFPAPFRQITALFSSGVPPLTPVMSRILAVNYALAVADNPRLPQITSLALLSLEIGASEVAALAVWQARLGILLGLDKLAWNDLLPEYDPYKYGSFAVNAGDVAHRSPKKFNSESLPWTTREN
jgi:hypothetical protein